MRAIIDGLSEDDVRSRIQTYGPKVQAMRLSYDLEKKEKTFICELKLTRRKVFEVSSSVVAELTKAPGVLHVRWF